MGDQMLDSGGTMGSGSGEKLINWLETLTPAGLPPVGSPSSSGGMLLLDPGNGSAEEEEASYSVLKDFLANSLSVSSGDDFCLPPSRTSPATSASSGYTLPSLQQLAPFMQPPPQSHVQNPFQMPMQQQSQQPAFLSPPDSSPLQQQLQHLQHLQQMQEAQRQYQHQMMWQQRTQPQYTPEQMPIDKDTGILFGSGSLPLYQQHVTSIPSSAHIPIPQFVAPQQQMPQQQLDPSQRSLPPLSQAYPDTNNNVYAQRGECTFAHFVPSSISTSTVFSSSTFARGMGGGVVLPLSLLNQPFYQSELTDFEEDEGIPARRSKSSPKNQQSIEEEDRDSEIDEGEERPKYPFILKLATKRKEEEHMRFSFGLDQNLRGRPILLTIKEEILQRPPRKEKTPKAAKAGGSPKVKTEKEGGSRGRGKGSSTKKTKTKECEKEEPAILFRGRIDPGTSGAADMRASSIHGLATPLHWVLDRAELSLTFKAAEGTGMNIIRYQFHVQAADDDSPSAPAYVGVSVPGIICSHSTSQFERALISLIHYHFRNQELVVNEDVLACFELLAGPAFRKYREAFATFPLPAGSTVLRGTDIPAVIEWFLKSWGIFSVDNYMALYKMGYVHGFLDREEAQEFLLQADEGTFLIRLGSNGLSMSIRYGGQIMPVEIDPNTLKQISITVAADPAVNLLCRDGSLMPKDRLIQAITSVPRFGYASVARLASLAKERQEHNSQEDMRTGDEGDNKRKRNK